MYVVRKRLASTGLVDHQENCVTNVAGGIEQVYTSYVKRINAYLVKVLWSIMFRVSSIFYQRNNWCCALLPLLVLLLPFWNTYSNTWKKIADLAEEKTQIAKVWRVLHCLLWFIQDSWFKNTQTLHSCICSSLTRPPTRSLLVFPANEIAKIKTTVFAQTT